MWIDPYLNTNQRKPFKPSTVFWVRGLEQEETKFLIANRKMGYCPIVRLDLFEKNILLVSVEEQDTIEKRLKEYTVPLMRNQYSQAFATKRLVPAFKRKQESDVEVVQESLLEGLPETKLKDEKNRKNH